MYHTLNEIFQAWVIWNVLAGLLQACFNLFFVAVLQFKKNLKTGSMGKKTVCKGRPKGTLRLCTPRWCPRGAAARPKMGTLSSKEDSVGDFARNLITAAFFVFPLPAQIHRATSGFQFLCVCNRARRHSLAHHILPHSLTRMYGICIMHLCESHGRLKQEIFTATDDALPTATGLAVRWNLLVQRQG